MVGSILSGKDGILRPGESCVPLPGGKVGKWTFTGQRRSVVDSKQAWKEAGASRSGFLQCLTVKLALHWALEESRKDFK